MQSFIAEEKAQSRFRLLCRTSGFGTANNHQPPRACIVIFWSPPLRQPRPCGDWQPQIVLSAGRQPDKTRLGYANDHEGQAVEPDGPSHGVGRSAKGALPVSLTLHVRRLRRWLVVSEAVSAPDLVIIA